MVPITLHSPAKQVGTNRLELEVFRFDLAPVGINDAARDGITHLNFLRLEAIAK